MKNWLACEAVLRRWLFATLALAACLAPCAAPALTPQSQPLKDAKREQARSLTAAGNFIQALALYDQLTASTSSDLSLYVEARHAARDAGDKRRLAIYAERQIKIDPNDYMTRGLISMAYREAGDEQNAERARAAYIKWWKASKDPDIRSKPFLMIDKFQAGPLTVNVMECLETGGPFGVGYMFDVWGPKALPLPPQELAENHRARIVLEHNKLDQRIKSELTHTDAPVTPSLDALDGTGHTTLGFFKEEPSYKTLREIAKRYIGDGKNLAAKPPMKRAWQQITCMPADK